MRATAVGLLIWLGGCEEPELEWELPGTCDTTGAFRVTTLRPADGAAAVHGDLLPTLVLSRAPDPASVIDGITIEGVPGRTQLDGRTLTFIPDDDLPDDLHEVQISREIRDEGGELIATPPRWSFSTRERRYFELEERMGESDPLDTIAVGAGLAGKMAVAWSPGRDRSAGGIRARQRLGWRDWTLPMDLVEQGTGAHLAVDDDGDVLLAYSSALDDTTVGTSIRRLDPCIGWGEVVDLAGAGGVAALELDPRTGEGVLLRQQLEPSSIVAHPVDLTGQVGPAEALAGGELARWEVAVSGPRAIVVLDETVRVRGEDGLWTDPIEIDPGCECRPGATLLHDGTALVAWRTESGVLVRTMTNGAWSPIESIFDGSALPIDVRAVSTPSGELIVTWGMAEGPDGVAAIGMRRWSQAAGWADLVPVPLVPVSYAVDTDAAGRAVFLVEALVYEYRYVYSAIEQRDGSFDLSPYMVVEDVSDLQLDLLPTGEGLGVFHGWPYGGETVVPVWAAPLQ